MQNSNLRETIVGVLRENNEVRNIGALADALEAALSAQVQDESEIVDCLLAGKPFVFDPATNFGHADDGGAPEHGIKYVPAAQVRDVAGLVEVVEAMARFDGRNNNSHLKQMAKDALAAYRTAPARQEGGR